MVTLLSRPFHHFFQSIGRPYGTLLVVLITIILVYPFLELSKWISWIFDLVMLGMISSAIRVNKGQGHASIVICLFGVSAVIFSSLGRNLGWDSFYPVGAGLRVLFLWYMLIVIFCDTLGCWNVTFDTIMGASCAYILLGLAFASVYSLLDWFQPASFQIPPSPEAIARFWGDASRELSLTYFSLVTMTTIGYGEILPVSPLARNLTVLEAMLGQLYLTVVIARLVGIEIASRIDTHA
ncbi:ion channel [Kiritimatiellaeota bacterium B1221]|nr:ion channel [Kiritimatiellaeota bacterium B1221]